MAVYDCRRRSNGRMDGQSNPQIGKYLIDGFLYLYCVSQVSVAENECIKVSSHVLLFIIFGQERIFIDLPDVGVRVPHMYMFMYQEYVVGYLCKFHLFT